MSDAPDNVVFLTVKTALDVPVERILDGARDANLAQVLVLGKDAAGLYYAAASTAHKGALILLCEEFKHMLLAGKYDND